MYLFFIRWNKVYDEYIDNKIIQLCFITSVSKFSYFGFSTIYASIEIPEYVAFEKISDMNWGKEKLPATWMVACS